MNELTENSEILMLTDKAKKGFIGMVDFGTGDKYTWAFTSKQKAEEFIILGRQKGYLMDVNILYRTTPAEFWQKEKESYLTIDPIGEKVWNYAGMCGDATKENIKVTKWKMENDVYLIEKSPKV